MTFRCLDFLEHAEPSKRKNRNIKLIHDIIRILLTLIYSRMPRLWFPHKNDVQFDFLPPVVCRRFHVLFILLLSVCLQWCPMRFVSCKRQELLTLRDYLGSPPVIDFFVFLLFCVPSVSGLSNLDCLFGFALPCMHLNITWRWFWCILQIFFFDNERKPFFFHNRSDILIQENT